ncbi:MAG TPA: 3-isopropylmalate dehydratase, partial [Dehalococcoidales bacterium]|nr:3-isopropylmalate dehydratase [Dehalococcoidales bacterium]
MDTSKLRGKAWIFGDILDVDFDICPIETTKGLNRPKTEKEFGAFCMTNIDPDFPKKVKEGDFIIAGINFGYGHDHESAPLSIKGCGVSGVICESTNRNFLRNSVHIGVPVIELPGIKSKVKQGDELEVNLKAGTMKNLTTGESMIFSPYPDFLLEIIEAGGLY